MVQVIWTEPAIDDLQQVHDFIARDSARNARVVVRRLRDAARRLERFPLSGRVIPEFPGGPYREIIERPYRIAYRYLESEEQAVIIAVAHGRRPLPPLLERG